MCQPTCTSGFNGLNLLVEQRIGLAQVVVPELLPRDDFRIAQEDPPQRDVIAIYRPLAGRRATQKLLKAR